MNKLEEEVLDGYTNLVVLRNRSRAPTRPCRAEGLSARILEETERLKQQLADADKDTMSRREAIERLKPDLKSLEDGTRRLAAGTPIPASPASASRGSSAPATAST